MTHCDQAQHELCEKLAEIYDNDGLTREVLARSGIDRTWVNFDQAAIAVWREIVELAIQQNKLAQLKRAAVPNFILLEAVFNRVEQCIAQPNPLTVPTPAPRDRRSFVWGLAGAGAVVLLISAALTLWPKPAQAPAPTAVPTVAASQNPATGSVLSQALLQANIDFSKTEHQASIDQNDLFSFHPQLGQACLDLLAQSGSKRLKQPVYLDVIFGYYQHILKRDIPYGKPAKLGVEINAAALKQAIVSAYRDRHPITSDRFEDVVE
ncbi:MAG: effector-associated domain EAD1-containing protein [Anaerolineae bacterium]|nr:effector-associated domain EAD1-containing protein [Anaerolineae bacterium]